MNLDRFLRTVITGGVHSGTPSGTPSGTGALEGWLCTAVGPNDGERWLEEWYKWPDDLPKLIERVAARAAEHNVYFSSYLFQQPQSRKQFVLPTRTIQADLDEADIHQLPIRPTVLVRTSPGRHQAFWVLREQVDLDVHEILSRKITYAIDKCDRSGWPLGRKVRLPGTLNFKYAEPKPVEVVEESGIEYNPADFELLPSVPQAVVDQYDEKFLEGGVKLDIGPHELLERIRELLPPKVVQTYDVATRDRSATLWSLMLSAFRAGCTRDEVFVLAQNSANNKFADLRYHGDRELAKDVLRAESLLRTGARDERSVIMSARRMPGVIAERRQHIFELVLKFMQEAGEFIHSDDDMTWYVRRDTGRPISISRHSEWLSALLEVQFGLNRSEVEQVYVLNALESYARMLPVTGTRAALTHSDIAARTLLLHTGRKEVMRITPLGVETTVNGANGLIFPWRNEIQPFTPSPSGSYIEGEWAEALFRTHCQNVLGLRPDEFMAMMKAWFLFLLFRNEALSRPILSLFGQPGSGKSTLLKRLYVLLYGAKKSVGSVTGTEDFDHSVAYDPLYAIDNADTWERWLPDRLALSAGTSDIQKRKLYTDTDIITIKRNAMIAISAHNPRFGREDVSDRLLIFTFHRLTHFESETDIMRVIAARRNQLWGSIIHDVQRVLATPRPPAAQAPQFRVEDFATMGFWFARALGFEREFVNALSIIKGAQRSFTLDEDQILVLALRRAISNMKNPERFRSPGELWQELEVAAPDTQSFQRVYRNSVYLGKKLFSLQEALKVLFEIEWHYEPKLAIRMWRFRERDDVSDTSGSRANGVAYDTTSSGSSGSGSGSSSSSDGEEYANGGSKIEAYTR